MRTRINASWVVGWDGTQHQIIRDGVCVVEDDHILHVGKSYDGPVDQTIEAHRKLVSPGLITTHCHTGTNAGNELYLDVGRPDILGANYLNGQAGLPGRPRHELPVRLRVLWRMGQALHAGVTTVVEVAAGGNPADYVAPIEEIGVRVYTGPMFLNARAYSRNDGAVEYEWDDARGAAGLKSALAFAERYDGAAGGRLRAMICPGHTDTCTPALLKESAEAARRLDIPLTVHASINIQELDRTLQMYRLTPIQLLEQTGVLDTRAILSHAVFLSGHSWTRYRDVPELEILGKHHTTISHSPLKYLHMGAYLESLRRYIQAGVNVTIGTDFHPGDQLLEMRTTMLMSRVADRSYLSGTPRDVFDAATINAARGLGRDDLGRLAPGTRADLTIWDLNKMHFGAVNDPIRSLVETGHSSDVDLVMVDGKVVVRDGRLATLDQDALLEECQKEGDEYWADVPNWSWGSRSLQEIAPSSYPIG